MTAKAVMVLGTSSHAGKSLLTAALCRIFFEQGIKVAPFKSQNMSLNSAATVEGLEIGRAQALQAEAAGIAPSVHMNPILLKPAGKLTSQIVVHGRIWGRLTAVDYHRRRVEELLPLVRDSYETLARKYQVMVLEGAGSPVEINLKQHDIVNMRMAEMADAACLLVGDIDRGGVFASLLGTMELLDPEEQKRIGGFVINKFRGDQSLLAPGIRMMEDRMQKPCLGVIPYIEGLALEEEDSLGLPPLVTAGDPQWTSKAEDRPLRIAVVALPSFSNFTDFDALRSEPSVLLRFFRDPSVIPDADIVIIPGSKQTSDDLSWMREQKLDGTLIAHARTGLTVGICGGMQMLGQQIIDPNGVETEGHVEGLGLLPMRTIMRSVKTTSPGVARVVSTRLFGQCFEKMLLSGYEIHVGETEYMEYAQPFAQLSRQGGEGTEAAVDGCIASDGRIFGTYLHGVFDEDRFRHAFIEAARKFHRLEPAQNLGNWKERREASFDRLAFEVSRSLDMSRIFQWAGVHYQDETQR